MKTQIKIMVILFLFSMATGIIQAEETIRLTNGEWKPYLSKSLKHYGVISHIVTEAFQLEGIKVEYGFYPWKRSYSIAQTGEWDSVIWYKNEERERSFYFSDPVLHGETVFFHLKTFKLDWNSMGDLKDVRIGATMGYNYNPEFEKAEKDGLINVDRGAVRDEQNFKKILAGRINVFPIFTDVGFAVLQDNLKPEEVKMFTYHPKPLRVDPGYLMLTKANKKNEELVQRFNKGLDKLRKSGKLDQFYENSRQGLYKQ